MALGINTNVASINAQNQLSKSQSQNDQALERLSSGLRINSAKDDAAGLAISTRFESQINGLNQASRNANDGISLAQTAEGGLDEITNNLQRVRELAVQSANATNNDSDRQALNDEVQQRLEEIDRISGQTAFNGLNVLDGSLGGQDFQVGANVGETIEVDLEDGARTSQLGGLAEAGLNFDGSAGSFSLSVGDGEATEVSVESGDSAADIAESVASVNGVNEATATTTQDVDFDEISFTDADSGGEDDGGTFSFDLSVGEVNETIEIGVDSSSDSITASRVQTEIENKGIEGLSVSEDSDTLTFNDDQGRNIELTSQGFDGNSDTEVDTSSNDLGDGLGFDDGDLSTTFVGQVDIQANDELNVANTDSAPLTEVIETDDDGNESTEPLAADESYAVEASGSLDNVNVSDEDAANDAITRIDASLNSVNSIRSELGAVQNRFESTISNLDNNTENLEASNSRIKDADFASESAKLSQSQVLQQAGISVLSQANQRPQQVLSLLQ